MTRLASLQLPPDQAARLAQLLKLLSAAVREPARNPVTALVVLGVAALLLLLVVAIVFLIVTLFQEWRDPLPEEAARRTRDPSRDAEGVSPAALLIWAAVAGLLILGLSFAYGYGTSDSACQRCHVMKRAFVSRSTDTHAKIACSSCHVPPGATGVFTTLVSGANNLRVQLVSRPSAAATGQAPVPDASCLTCHRGVTSGVVVAAGTRMRHSDVIAVGYACTDCHSTAGHGAGTRTPVRYPTMGQCVQCHDGTKAPAACTTCHSRDVGVPSAQRAVAQDIPKAAITPDGCRGCHSMKTCIACHGIELPHSLQFQQGFHARKALLEPQVCVKCHSVTQFCNGCHQFRTQSGGLPLAPHGDTAAAFISWHAKAGPPTSDTQTASCSCHTQGGSPRGPVCQLCHGKQPDR